MKIKLNRIDDEFLFEMTNENQQTILLNNLKNSSNPNKGVSPMESLLMGIAGCSSIDMIAILKKQRQKIDEFSAWVEADRESDGDATPFSKIILHFDLSGEIDAKKALRAASLSFDKYCSVSKSLNPTIQILWDITLNKKKIEA